MDMQALRNDILSVLQEEIIPFWLKRGVDERFGGYLTCYDEDGNFTGDFDKLIITQTRMIWGFSYLSDFCRPGDKPAMLAAARQGRDFFLAHFWDEKNGGFHWKTDREGKVLDSGKLVYGQSFGIYALAEYARHTGDGEALTKACETFALLQLHAADTLNGGYYENLESDWSLSPGGVYAGDRKSLDIHMHLMEAFDTLYAATNADVHGRKLQEVIELLLKHMINTEKGYGYNQFDAAFNRIPAINIYRTWNFERETGEVIETPTDTTSYGHNVELSWLMNQALDRLGGPSARQDAVLRRLLDHSLKHGYDYEFGGVYRDGIADGQVLVTDKEWWQNFEALVGYSNGYLRFGRQEYLKALLDTWEFDKKYFLNRAVGESRQLLSRQGQPISGNMGNPWKGIYHTGRALAETVLRLDRILEGKQG